MLMRTQALAGGRDVRNKGLGPVSQPGASRRLRAAAKILWDD